MSPDSVPEEGTLVIAETGNLTLTNSTLNTDVANAGTLPVRNHSSINGALTTTTYPHVFREAFLNVTNGTLINSAGATISALTGARDDVRQLNAELDNRGTLEVETGLSINIASADHQNSGTINVTGGNLVVAQSGTTPSLGQCHDV